MKKSLLSKKVLCSVLAMSVLGMSSAALANSGGTDEDNHYVGLYPSGSNVIIDESIDGAAYGSRILEGTASNNTVTVSADCLGVKGAYVVRGNVVNNKVIIDGGTMGSVYGADINEGDATGNSVIINGGTMKSVYGAYLVKGNAAGNSVVINGGTMQSIYGARLSEGNATGNSVIINDGDITGNIYGVYLKNNGNAEGNSVVINGGTLHKSVYGAKISGTGDALNNIVIINDGLIISEEIGMLHGTIVHKGNTLNNAMIINGGKINSSLTGGTVMTFGDSIGNSVIINDVQISDASINGGNVSSIGKAEHNNVTINGGTMTNIGLIDGGFVKNGDAAGNSVVINGGKITKDTFDGPADRTDIFGATVENGKGENNAVVINGGEIDSAQIAGANITKGDALNNYVMINGGAMEVALAYGAIVQDGNAQGNTIVVNNGDTGFLCGADIKNQGTAAGNAVIVNNGSIEGSIYGAMIEGETASKAAGNGIIVNGGSVDFGRLSGAAITNGTAEGNYVILNNIKSDYGFDVYGASVVTGDALNNQVHINGVKAGSIFGAYTQEGNALNNQVNINGGKIIGTVYGGYTGNGKAEGNVITISGDADLSEATLVAGYANDNTGKVLLNEAGSANTIKLNGWSGSVAAISGTDVIEINGSKLTDKGILHITDDGNTNTNLSGTTIKVNSIAGGQNVAEGDILTIITSKNNVNLGITEENIEISEDGIMGGVASSINGVVDVNDNTGETVFYVKNVQASKQTATTTETRAAAAAMVNQGGEVIADTLSKLNGNTDVEAFATISGNSSKYKTGSFVDINGWNGIVGVAKTVDANSGKLSYGAFFENGSGNYNTHNDFNGNILRGDGHAVYNGGGMLLRYAKENGVYTEASVRAGLAKNEVSNALAETSGATHGFKTENAYYGAHVGIGKVIELEKGKSWDIYGKYFYTHHEGDSVTIANDNFDFDAVDSSRLRLGARFSEEQSAKLSSYYGLAWEYEFDGEAGGTVAGHALYTPSLKGSTVIGELGFRYTPDKASGWYFDASLKGYAGQQEGLSGSVQAVYSF